MPALVDVLLADMPVALVSDDSVGPVVPDVQRGLDGLLSAANAAADRALSGDSAAFLEQSRQQHDGE